ncbi:MAG: LytR C-terminal domain-containing protein [Gaiellaceae bacterium]
MEHVQPYNRPFPRRTVALAAGLLLAVALLVAGGLALAHRQQRTRPVPGTSRVPKRQVAAPLRPRSRVSVLVLNGNGIEGAAGTEASAVLALGYRHAIPGDAPSLDYARSLVLFRPGWQREAERLGREARIPTVAPLDGRVAPDYAHVPLVLILGAN